MQCRNCGFINNDGDTYCMNCGEPLGYNDGTYKDSSYGAPYSSEPGAYPPPCGSYAPHEKAPAPAPSLSDYLKWMLLYPLICLIPGVGFLAYIVLIAVMAFTGDDKNKSTFFKAQFISLMIGFAVAVVITVLVIILFGSVFLAFDSDIFEDIISEFQTIIIL